MRYISSCVPLTIQSETPACSGHPNLSEPSSSCKRWDNPGCRGVGRDSVTGHEGLPLCVNAVIINICRICTWYRARPHGGSLDNADTESTGERNAPPVCSGERSAIHDRGVRHDRGKVINPLILTLGNLKTI